MEVLALLIQVLCYVLIAAIFLRIIFSWINFDPTNPIYTMIHEITEPILGPLRSVLPRAGMLDLSPMAASFILFFIAQLGAGLAD